MPNTFQPRMKRRMYNARAQQVAGEMECQLAGSTFRSRRGPWSGSSGVRRDRRLIPLATLAIYHSNALIQFRSRRRPSLMRRRYRLRSRSACRAPIPGPKYVRLTGGVASTTSR